MENILGKHTHSAYYILHDTVEIQIKIAYFGFLIVIPLNE